MLYNLQNNGYEVTTAGTGNQALRLISEKDFDIIIIDISLPDIDSLKIIKEIKEKDHRKVVILVTVSNNFEAYLEMLNFGADDYVIKPCSIKEIVFRIQKNIQRIEIESEKTRLENIISQRTEHLS